jgi:riboflavin biosynthesis pyrimidine reductase
MRRVFSLTPDAGQHDGGSGELTEEQVIAAYRPDRAEPMIRVNMISSLDGAATLEGKSGTLGNPNDQAVLGYLRLHADVLLVGANTVRVEGYSDELVDDAGARRRQQEGLAARPRLAIVSSSLDLPDRVFAGRGEPVIVITHERAPDRWSTVADVIRCGDDRVDLAAARAALHDRGLTQVLSEGGPHLLGGLSAAGLVDELCVTISPLLVGPGPSRITAGPPDRLRPATLLHVLTDEELLFLRYRLRPAPDAAR